MAEDVVDRLEPIEVEQGERQRLAAVLADGDQLGEALLEGVSVETAREPVDLGRLAQLSVALRVGAGEPAELGKPLQQLNVAARDPPLALESGRDESLGSAVPAQ